MQTIIFDTNVLLDLFVFNDFRALHLKQALIEGKLNALATPSTLEEFADVIARPVFSLDEVQQTQIRLEWQGLARLVETNPFKISKIRNEVSFLMGEKVHNCILIGLMEVIDPCILLGVH